MRPIALLLGALTLIGMAGLFTYIGAIVAKHTAGFELENDAMGWFIIAWGIYGGLAALLFGPLTIVLWRKLS